VLSTGQPVHEEGERSTHASSTCWPLKEVCDQTQTQSINPVNILKFRVFVFVQHAQRLYRHVYLACKEESCGRSHYQALFTLLAVLSVELANEEVLVDLIRLVLALQVGKASLQMIMRSFPSCLLISCSVIGCSGGGAEHPGASVSVQPLWCSRRLRRLPRPAVAARPTSTAPPTRHSGEQTCVSVSSEGVCVQRHTERVCCVCAGHRKPSEGGSSPAARRRPE